MKKQPLKRPAQIKNYDSFCPVQRTIEVIQPKWTLMILRDLLTGKKRFGQLRRSLSGVSPKTLSLRLKELESLGILKKEIFAEVPPKVEYELTEKGTKLGDVISAMAKWSSQWMPEEEPAIPSLPGQALSAPSPSRSMTGASGSS